MVFWLSYICIIRYVKGYEYRIIYKYKYEYYVFYVEILGINIGKYDFICLIMIVIVNKKLLMLRYVLLVYVNIFI